MQKKSDVLIIGGGIIGCAIACHLADARKVTVIEAAGLCKEASWAAAGMLAPCAEMFHHLPEPMQRFMFKSAALYDDFIAGLVEDSGVYINYQKQGSLIVAFDYQESRLLAGLLERLNKADLSVEIIEHKQLRLQQPGLAENIESALFLPQDKHVNPRQLANALISACHRKGVNFQIGEPAVSLELRGGEIQSVQTSNEKYFADNYLIAAGAWSGGLLKSIGYNFPVRPIRGQIIELWAQPQSIRQLLHTSGCYMAPWPDGRTLIGATMENAGFDKNVSAGGVAKLLNAAMKAVPGLKSATIGQTWTGLRPDTSDNMPIIGATPVANLFMATGHFRNGILLAPGTARLIGDLLEGRNIANDIEAFRASRFID